MKTNILLALVFGLSIYGVSQVFLKTPKSSTESVQVVLDQKAERNFTAVSKSISRQQASQQTSQQTSRDPLEDGFDCQCTQRHLLTSDLTVVKKLPDDRRGSRHQKWILKSPSGKTVQFVHNLEMCQRLDLNVGDQVNISGEFKWTGRGGLLHWAHFVPEGWSGSRKGGYVEWKGRRYCETKNN